MACAKPIVPLCITRGSTNDIPIRIESDVWRYVAITGIEQSAPVVIEAP